MQAAGEAGRAGVVVEEDHRRVLEATAQAVHHLEPSSWAMQPLHKPSPLVAAVALAVLLDSHLVLEALISPFLAPCESTTASRLSRLNLRP